MNCLFVLPILFIKFKIYISLIYNICLYYIIYNGVTKISFWGDFNLEIL